jgi:hypothetical protein
VPGRVGCAKDARGQNANVVSGVLSEPCAIHRGPPPDTDVTDWYEAWDCRLTNAGLLPSVLIGAIAVLSGF